MTSETALSALQGGLIVSCQAGPGEPLDSPKMLAAMARAAVEGGAVAIRANRPENIRAIRKAVRVPLIGLFKKEYPDSSVYITATLDDALAVAEAGADIIALDATLRRRPQAGSLNQIVRALRVRTAAVLMADVATLEEGLNAFALGFDLIGTTLSGYTDETRSRARDGLPDLDLISALRQRLPKNARIVAEGRIATPQHAVEALRRGAYAVVVGTAVTAPAAITRGFHQAIQQCGTRGHAHAIGVDLGGTKTAIALVSAAGNVTHKLTQTTPWSEGTAAVVAAIKEGIQKVLVASGQHVEGIGIGASGRVNSSKGVVFDGVPLTKDYFGFPLAEQISLAFGKTVGIENDANAAAFAEYRIGGGQLAQRLVCLTIGTGIGGGIVLDGKLLRGRGNAGEFGHITVVARGRRCPCGRRGCLERYVSRKLMERELLVLARSGLLRLPQKHASIDSALIMRWIRTKEPAALKVFERQMDYLAAGLENIFNSLDPDRVVLSGEISKLGAILTRALTKRLARPMTITTSSLGNDAGLIGAALLALESSEGAVSR